MSERKPECHESSKDAGHPDDESAVEGHKHSGNQTGGKSPDSPYGNRKEQ